MHYYLILRPREIYEKTWFYQLMNRIAISPVLDFVMGFLIILNTISLSMDRYPIEVSELNQLETINDICTFLYLIEMIIKILGFGLIQYLLDKINWIDATVVLFSIVDFILKSQDDTLKNTSITFIRAFRLLRIAKFAMMSNDF